MSHSSVLCWLLPELIETFDMVAAEEDRVDDRVEVEDDDDDERRGILSETSEVSRFIAGSVAA